MAEPKYKPMFDSRICAFNHSLILPLDLASHLLVVAIDIETGYPKLVVNLHIK